MKIEADDRSEARWIAHHTPPQTMHKAEGGELVQLERLDVRTVRADRAKE